MSGGECLDCVLFKSLGLIPCDVVPGFDSVGVSYWGCIPGFEFME